MARMKKPGWNACEELKKVKIKSNEAEIENEEKGNGEPAVMHPPRIKTLAQATRNEIPGVKAKIKAMLPMLQQTEVRRYKIPHYESVVLELEEENLQIAANYIRRLLQIDKNLREKAGAGTIIWRKPWLKNQNDLIDLLRDGLTIVNRAKQQRELMTEAAAFLEMALSFESKTWEWWWIAEEFYKSALEAGRKIRIGDGQTETILHYLYGRFLLNKMHELEKSLEHLNIAWNKSRNKNWNASKILGTKQKPVFRETCMLLHKAYLDLAKKLKKDNPKQAVEACVQALEKAQDSDYDEYVADALYELGKCELNSSNTKEALHNFSKYLALVKRLGNPEGICNAHMQMAFSYKQIKSEENTMKHFRLFKDSATEFQLPYKLADAHYFTGEHLLNGGKPELATPHLEFSVLLYRSLNAINKFDRARCVAGVSKGQEIMESYVKLILDSGKKNSKAMLKLCKWKNNREPFWIEKSDDQNFEKESSDEIENQESKISMDSLFFSLSASSENSAQEVKNQEETTQEKIQSSREKIQSSREKIQSQMEKNPSKMENTQSQKEGSQNPNKKIHVHE